MRKQARSEALGQWLSSNRAAQKRTQLEVAKKAKMSQQRLSRIEKLGVVPNDEQLERLCAELEKPIADARDIIRGSATTQAHLASFESDFLAFTDSIVARARQAERLRIFVVRDDNEEFDSASVELHLAIFSKAPNIYETVLFRHSDNRIWESFRFLAAAVEKAANGSIPKLKERLSGYHRSRDLEEDRSREIPMAPPAVLLFDGKTVPMLYFYGSDSDIELRLRQAGADEAAAQRQSMRLLRGRPEKATLFANWIGAEGKEGLDPQKWTCIPWPE